MAARSALVTGVAGQDGVHLARLLIAEGTRVVGTARPGSASAAAMAPYLEDVTVVEHDLRDAVGFEALLGTHRPDEVYNLAGVTSVRRSWDEPDLTAATNAAAVEALLATLLRTAPATRFFQAASAEQLGEASHSPYAASKAAAQESVRRYREDHGLHACSAVLFGHESPIRPLSFVTRKISRAVAEIARGRRDSLTLGNTAVRRDWGHAAEFVEAMPLMLRRDEPVDLTLATGRTHTLDELVSAAFAAAGIDDATPYLGFDPDQLRPADAAVLAGDTAPAREALGWSARTTALAVMAEMVAMDLHRLGTGVEEDPRYLDRSPLVQGQDVSGR